MSEAPTPVDQWSGYTYRPPSSPRCPSSGSLPGPNAAQPMMRSPSSATSSRCGRAASRSVGSPRSEAAIHRVQPAVRCSTLRAASTSEGMRFAYAARHESTCTTATSRASASVAQRRVPPVMRSRYRRSGRRFRGTLRARARPEGGEVGAYEVLRVGALAQVVGASDPVCARAWVLRSEGFVSAPPLSNRSATSVPAASWKGSSAVFALMLVSGSGKGPTASDERPVS